LHLKEIRALKPERRWHYAAVLSVISLETYSSKVVSGMRRDPSMRKRAANLRTVRPAPSGHEAEPGWIPVPADDYRVTAVNTGLGWML
jgi:hypothetical protein